MLVLTRRVGESLVIGDDVVVTVLEVRSDGVRVGNEAPRHVRVHRPEVLDAVRVENVTAVQADDAAAAALRGLVPRSDHQAAPGTADAPGGQDAPDQG